jgi:anti-anti-sigma factor
MNVPALDVQTRPDRDRLVVSCHGDLDHFSSGVVRDAVAAARREGWTRIVLDFSGLDFMDSSGIRLLQDARDGALGAAEWSMVDSRPSVAFPLELVGAQRLLPAAA